MDKRPGNQSGLENRRWDGRPWALGLAAWLAAGATIWAADVVKTAQTRYSGRLVQMTSLEVTIATAVKNETIPVNQIQVVEFDQEPLPLRNARKSIASGRYEEALSALEGIKDEIARAEIKQDVEFYTALAASRLALSGGLEINEAGRLMADFEAKYPQNYHYLEANEMVGNLLVANMDYGKARKYFDRLGRAPWPDYKMRAAVAVGQVLLAEGKPEEALKSFEGVLNTSADDELTRIQHLAATLGKARCLAETKRTDEAIRIANDVIAKAGPDEVSLLARAYNALGVALQKAGRTQEALFAFLHVETLYAADGDAHAEALFHLAQVWQELKNFGRAQETRRKLQSQYKESRWGKALEKQG
jgi:tetratricopeptide (TPR) repeat protein